MGGTCTTGMNLNSAKERELPQLRRIGMDKARKIVRYRTTPKGFRDWADFARTPGFTQPDVEAIRTRAWIGPPAEDSWALADRRCTDRDAGSHAASAAGFWSLSMVVFGSLLPSLPPWPPDSARLEA